VSELRELVSKERGREPAVRQQPGCVGKGCQKSGCGGDSDCRVVVIYSVVNCKAKGVRRDSAVLGCEV
jgi:hypothetical protein